MCIYNVKMLIDALEQNGIFIEDYKNMEEKLLIDSISFVTLVIDLEDMFNISFDDDDFKRISANNGITIRLLETIIREKLVTTDL